MSNPMRIRANANGDTVEVKVLIRHVMETGQRKDSSGNPIPPHFIQTLVAKANDKVVLESQMGTSVSKDPFLSFKYKGAKGDKITISWKDNKGETSSSEATVS